MPGRLDHELVVIAFEIAVLAGVCVERTQAVLAVEKYRDAAPQRVVEIGLQEVKVVRGDRRRREDRRFKALGERAIRGALLVEVAPPGGARREPVELREAPRVAAIGAEAARLSGFELEREKRERAGCLVFGHRRIRRTKG